MCEPCAKELFERSSNCSPPKCPVCSEMLTSEDGAAYFPDRFVRREVSNLKVKCVNHLAGCPWQGKLTDFQEHVKACPNAKKSCPLYGLGCPDDHKMSHEELLDHLTSGKAAIDHFQYLAKNVMGLLGGKKSKPSSQLSSSDNHYGDLLNVQPKTHGAHTEVLLRRVGGRIERDGAGRSTTTLHSVDSLDSCSDFSEPEHVLKQLGKVREEIEHKLKVEMRKKDEEISQLKMQISTIEKKVQAKETESEDRGFRLSLLENVSYDGTMIWKIPQFAQRMTDAQSGKYTSIFSLPFYTSRYGYKLCLRLYILGDGIGKGTHMSLFFVVMRGEFDNILQWPFTHKVTFRLLNQIGGKDIVDGFLPDPMSSSFLRPKTDMNVASGCPRFVTLSDLRTGGFIVDDTVFIKVKVDTSAAKDAFVKA
ncbi:hypothetical protein EMCRGX_G019750 [Ephydatia muelleri]